MPDTTDPLVSVIIPAYESEATIANALESVERQVVDFPYEIIVVNSSDDRMPDIINQSFPRVRLIQLEHKTLAAGARNHGASRSRGQYVAFLDSDCVVEPDWLSRLVRSHNDAFCAVGGPIENANPGSIYSRAGYVMEFNEFYARSGHCGVDHIPSGNLMLRRETFDKSGGFPVDFPFKQEDRLYSWRLVKQTGRQLLFCSDIRVKHNHRDSFDAFTRHQRDMGRGGAEILKVTDLRGSWLIRRRVLANAALPLLPIVKLTRCTLRTLRRKPSEILRHPLVLPVMMLGGFYWMRGFAAGVNAAAGRAYANERNGANVSD